MVMLWWLGIVIFICTFLVCIALERITTAIREKK